MVSTLDELEHGLSDAREMLDMAVEEEDAEIVDAVSSDLALMQEKVERLEFQRMFAGEMDANPCFIDITFNDFIPVNK